MMENMNTAAIMKPMPRSRLCGCSRLGMIVLEPRIVVQERPAGCGTARCSRDSRAIPGRSSCRHGLILSDVAIEFLAKALRQLGGVGGRYFVPEFQEPRPFLL